MLIKTFLKNSLEGLVSCPQNKVPIAPDRLKCGKLGLDFEDFSGWSQSLLLSALGWLVQLKAPRRWANAGKEWTLCRKCQVNEDGDRMPEGLPGWGAFWSGRKAGHPRPIHAAASFFFLNLSLFWKEFQSCTCGRNCCVTFLFIWK